jgi:hypothetical protein
MWIGGNLDDKRDWRWQDGTQVGPLYNNWGPNQPNGNADCLAIWTDNMWHDARCYHYQLKSLCKFNI